MAPVLEFPDPNSASEDGIVAIGGDLHPISLINAYRSGIFPWPIEGYPLTWFSPDPRAVLDFKDLHIPRSLKRIITRGDYQVTVDQRFNAVIRNCAEVKRRGQRGTWITDEMLDAYIELHRLGHAHSVEVWKDNVLIGGIYGVEADSTFSAESMFHLQPNASKIAVIYLIRHLQERHLDWIDIQTQTPHMETLGAKEISRQEFLDRLGQAKSKKLSLFD